MTIQAGSSFFRPRVHARSSRRGMVLLYTIISMTALLAVASLAVDLGHVQMAKTQLESATDGAARYAATGMRSMMLGVSGATANAQASLADNTVDGAAVPVTSSVVQTGIWNTGTRVFTPDTSTSANAVRVTTSMVMGNATHPLTFLPIFGKTVTIHAASVAMITGQDASTFVSAAGNPWLSGMPSGTLCTDFRTNPSEQDSAGSGPNVASSPALIGLSSLNVSAGSKIVYDGVTGGTNYGGGTTGNADGDATLICTLGSSYFGDLTYANTPMNGIANIIAPVDSMVAVFLDDTVPTSTAAPASLDFSTTTARDYESLAPKLKQPFFVGDGRRSTGEIQQITVPAGATRMFIANMDGWQYNNNTGGFNLTIHAITTISTVATN